MALLDLVDALIGNVIAGNIFTDLDSFKKNLLPQPQKIPDGAYSGMPNKDPRLLDLRPPAGFEHPHDAIALRADRRVIPPEPMHDTTGIFTNPTGQIQETKRRGFYEGVPVPQSVTAQAHNTEANKPLGPSEIAHLMSRGEIYGGVGPLSVPEQIRKLLANKPPPPAPVNLSREAIYGPNNSPPISPSQQAEIVAPLPRREINRESLYGPRPTPNIPPSVSDQLKNLSKDVVPPPDQVIHKLSTAEIYASSGQPSPSLSSNADLLALADFHESKTRPLSPTQTAERRLTGVDSVIPQTPEQAGPSQKKSVSLSTSNVVNEFAGVPSRPLNFRNEKDAPSRLSLVASYHKQKLGWNAENLEPGAQRRGMIEDNLYDNSDDLLEGNFQGPFRGILPLLNPFNIYATTHWLRNIGKELFVGNLQQGFQGTPPNIENFDLQKTLEGLKKGATFIATQFLLSSMNPANPENGIGNAIWNPLSIAAAVPVVGSADATNVTVGAALSTYKQNALDAESVGASRLLLARKGAYSEISPVHRLSKLYSPISEPGYIGDVTAVGSEDNLDAIQRGSIPTSIATIDSQLGGIGEAAVKSEGIHTNLYTDERTYGVSALFPQSKLLEASLQGLDPGKEKISNLFDFKPFPGGGLSDIVGSAVNKLISSNAISAKVTANSPGTWVAKPRFGEVDGFSQNNMVDAPGLNAGIVEAAVATELDGVTNRPLTGDEIYLDLMFQDLREDSVFLYFRAFLKNGISETFAPEWQTDSYYGRVDKVPIYKGTVRNINFTFDVAAFKYSDLTVIWNKLQKLQSMVYPTYTLRGFMEQGPFIRLKIGDLFAGENNRGLPGFITGMDWNFPDGIWEIQKDFKVPRLITVTINFTVVHDGNPGIYPKLAYELNENGEEVGSAPAERVFGSARFNKNNSDTTKVSVSRAEIRKIFATVRGGN